VSRTRCSVPQTNTRGVGRAKRAHPTGVAPWLPFKRAAFAQHRQHCTEIRHNGRASRA
jgi:hypothetical protein